mmetsp:Transcript_31062/g.76993  ORF Transcript_31062/g.76993 Transcript_31062/m.76993 type:complete len:216 (-) Transcript_31062:824-1471(-)
MQYFIRSQDRGFSRRLHQTFDVLHSTRSSAPPAAAGLADELMTDTTDSLAPPRPPPFSSWARYSLNDVDSDDAEQMRSSALEFLTELRQRRQKENREDQDRWECVLERDGAHDDMDREGAADVEEVDAQPSSSMMDLDDSDTDVLSTALSTGRHLATTTATGLGGQNVRVMPDALIGRRKEGKRGREERMDVSSGGGQDRHKKADRARVSFDFDA